MYKLENNVEWTQNLKNAFKTGTTYSSIIYNNVDYNESNYLKNATLEDTRYVTGLGFIGQATSRMLTIELKNDEITPLNFENADIQFKIGANYNNTIYYINYGNFIVNEAPENDPTNGTIKFKAYDYMIKFNKLYEDRVTYPCTLLTLLTDICSQAGVTLGTNDFANKNFSVENNQFEGKTLREVLQHIAKCAFSWARIGQDNKLYLDFEVSQVVDETITIDDYKVDSFKKANEYFGGINKVTYADSDIQGQEESVEDTADIQIHGEKELVIYDNYFAYTQAKRQSLIQAGTRLFGLKYMPIQQLEMKGLVYLDCTDIISIVDNDNNTYLSRVFWHTINYQGYVSDNIQNDGITETEQEYENVNDSPSQNQRIEVMIDRANKKIESIITDLEEDYATKLELSSAITQSSSDILATVSATYTTQETTSQIQATLQLKVNTADLVSEINASADTITLTAGRLVISSGNFQLDSSGNITANGGTIAGWNIVGTRLEKDNTSISGGYRSGMQNLSSGGGAVFYAGCNTAAGGTIASESASNFYVTQAGYLYCSNAKIGGTINSSSGNIGGFTLSSNSLSGSLSGLYDYDYFDLASVRGYIMGWIGGDSILKNIWDYDNSSSVTSTDYVNILNTIKGTLQNTKTMTGSFIINTTDPKRCIRIKKGNTDAVSIGLNGIESNLINTDELICGKIEFDEDPQGPSYFSGIIMRNNGTLVFLNQDVEKAKITKAGALTATSMSTNGFRVPEILKGGVDITPSAANTPTGLAISFSSSFSATPIVVATANTGAPGTQVTGVGVSGRSTTGCTLYVTRTNTTTTGIQWIAMN